MSYGLSGKIIDATTHEFIANCNLNYLKNLSNRSYTAQFDDVEPTPVIDNNEIAELLKYDAREFMYMLKKEALSELPLAAYDDGYTGNDAPKYIMDESDFEKYAEIIEKYKVNFDINEYVQNQAWYTENCINVFRHYYEHEDAIWYCKEDFEKAEEKIKKSYDIAQTKLRKLETLEGSKDWYELSENAKNGVLEDMSYIKEDVQDYEWRLWSVNKIINILDYYEEDYGYCHNGIYSSDYKDYKFGDRKVVIGIIVD